MATQKEHLSLTDAKHVWSIRFIPTSDLLIVPCHIHFISSQAVSFESIHLHATNGPIKHRPHLKQVDFMEGNSKNWNCVFHKHLGKHFFSYFRCHAEFSVWKQWKHDQSSRQNSITGNLVIKWSWKEDGNHHHLMASHKEQWSGHNDQKAWIFLFVTSSTIGLHMYLNTKYLPVKEDSYSFFSSSTFSECLFSSSSLKLSCVVFKLSTCNMTTWFFSPYMYQLNPCLSIVLVA